jgi:hypothetical protein
MHQSQNLPGEHKEIYVSTTLGIVIFTTVVCGGLTEPMLNRMGMRVASGGSGSGSSHGLLSTSEEDALAASSGINPLQVVDGTISALDHVVGFRPHEVLIFAERPCS